MTLDQKTNTNVRMAAFQARRERIKKEPGLRWDAMDSAWRYEWPAKYVSPSEQAADALRQWRRQATIDREEFLSQQKQCRDDRTTGRHFKEEASYCLQLTRACTLALPWFGAPDANQEAIRPCLWPIDLRSAMNEIAGRLVLRFG